MEDQSIEKVSISGPVLASMIQRFSTSRGAVDGLIFGHVTHIAPTLTDESSSASTLTATITAFVCSSSSLSFYSPSGRVDPTSLSRLVQSNSGDFLGWFSGRRRTQLRPSLREYAVSDSLASTPALSFKIQNPRIITADLRPSLFLLLSSPISDRTAVHTHDYRAYQFRASTRRFVPKSVDVVNIGPAFRGHYGAFRPASRFPNLPFELRLSPMNVDRVEESLASLKKSNKLQSELDMCAQGLEVKSLCRLMGPEAVSYTTGVEDLYKKMLVKIENLARQVEISSAKIREQEDHNRKLRHKAARSGGL